MTDTFDELRIIAKDARGLEKTDRDVIRRAADELEQAQRLLIATQTQLIQSQQRQIATNDQLIAARKAVPKPVTPIWTTLFSGRIQVKGWK